MNFIKAYDIGLITTYQNTGVSISQTDNLWNWEDEKMEDLSTNMITAEWAFKQPTQVIWDPPRKLESEFHFFFF